ncbi:FGGY-family carbohydrate kinase [Mesobacterium pallidum]|uniref:FGGY-family carbohydrate kinase n=1 Tax=Mesobacterium pallidum TaxID=2872037 RepID=UPI001EE2C3F2|nr:FGGY-family carbohydrate kinase [Mesobacterium pallidum]
MKVAVLDIGKTNAKVALVDTDSMTEIAVLTRPNRVLPGPPYPHFDIDGIWAFCLDGLCRMQADHGVDEVSVTTHGACFVLLDAQGALTCPVLDYEYDGPDAMAGEYDALRPAFADTGSPRLPKGLNAGAQLHWLVKTLPDLGARTAQVVSYPQYWSGRLTGTFATEPTSLGCHTDLWLPQEGRFSDLPDHLGLTMAPLAAASDEAGTILREIASVTGLRYGTPVRSGIHDSNASLLPYLHRTEGAFSVVSTGTWVICMSMDGDRVALDPTRDTLVNVNALGNPVPSARFMGGREYERIKPETSDPTPEDIRLVLAEGKALHPAVETGSGPFPGRTGGWSDSAMSPGEKGAALSLYLALMTSTCLDLIGARGPIIVEGPFARNELYLDMLRVRTGRAVLVSNTATGTSLGAALLCVPGESVGAALSERRDRTSDVEGLSDYGRRWHRISTAAHNRMAGDPERA